MDNTRHLIISIALALMIIVVGTSGYMIIEGWKFDDALYMTVITVSTVGYGEVQPVDGPGRFFTIVLVFFGVGFSLYVAGAIVQFMVEGSMRSILGRRRLDKKIKRLKNHYIVCGYGRIGRVLCNNLRSSSGVGLVAVEQSHELVPSMEEDNVLYLNADATDETVLLKAGIQKAKSLVAALATDTDNVFLVLTARQLNPDIYIVARASQFKSKDKLRAAGANSVESPYEMGAASMAQRILRPTVTSFLDLAFEHSRKDIQMEEIPVKDSSPLVDVMLKDSNIRQDFNLIIIAIKGRNGEMQFNPSFETVIRRGDTVIAVGQEANLHRLGRRMNGSG